MPSLSALLASSVVKLLGDGVPLLGPVDLNKFDQLLVFLGVPRPLLGLVLQLQELVNGGITGLDLVD